MDAIPVPQPPLPPQPSHLILLIAGLALFLGGLGGGFVLSQYLASPKPKTEPIAQIVEIPTQTSIPTPDPTANWKTYVHPTLNYSFSYPENLQIKTYDGKVSVEIDAPDPRLIVGICPRYISFSVADEKSKSISTNNKSLCVYSTSLIGNRVLIEAQYREGDKKIIDQILSTFRFLK